MFRKGDLIVVSPLGASEDFPDKDKDLLELGIGDYLIGPACRLAAGRGIQQGCCRPWCPLPWEDRDEFETSETFVRECLQQTMSRCLASTDPLPPLVVACNSDGIFKANNFLSSCPGLKKTLKAIYSIRRVVPCPTPEGSRSRAGCAHVRYDGAHALRPARAPQSLFS